MKKILIILMFLFILVGCSIGQIEDKNGPDDYTVVTITDKQILSNNNKYMEYGSVTVTKDNKTVINISKFSGIKEVLKFTKKTDVTISSIVEKGNFRIIIVTSDNNLKDIEINKKVDVTFNSGDKLKIVGESAKIDLIITKNID